MKVRFLEAIRNKVNSVQEACTKYFAVHLSKFENLQTTCKIIIIFFCYSPKHCFRLIEGQQSPSWRINFVRFRCGNRIRTRDSRTGGQGANQITMLTWTWNLFMCFKKSLWSNSSYQSTAPGLNISTTPITAMGCCQAER